jgi:hypothetical protein
MGTQPRDLPWIHFDDHRQSLLFRHQLFHNLLMANHSQHYKLIGWTLFFASLLLSSIPLFGQDAPMPQDIPLQKPKLLRDRDIQESLIRIGREPFNARIEDLRKIDDAEAEQRIAIVSAANKYVPGGTWHSESVIIGDFTCRGRKEQAILGITAREIIVVVFINGLQNKPEILRDKVHTPADAELTIADLDYRSKRTSWCGTRRLSAFQSMQGFKHC